MSTPRSPHLGVGHSSHHNEFAPASLEIHIFRPLRIQLWPSGARPALQESFARSLPTSDSDMATAMTAPRQSMGIHFACCSLVQLSVK